MTLELVRMELVLFLRQLRFIHFSLVAESFARVRIYEELLFDGIEKVVNAVQYTEAKET